MPWQETAARYAEATGRDGRHLYREVAWIVARQNGKTAPLVPLIVKRLREGRRMMHTAQDRSLPRSVHEEVADTLVEHFADELAPNRHGRYATRFSSGQEEIKMRNGGRYRIVAPTRGGARGPSNDDVIVDELREMDTWDFIAAAKPTMTVSRDPQIVYLSNAGDESSVVLNALRARAQTDPSLAYIEWSADPSRATDDVVGWAESNPAMGHEREGMGSVYETLVAEHRTALLEGTMSVFETEHLCRSVASLRSKLVDVAAWRDCEATVGEPVRPSMGVSLDPAGRRASAAIAWQVDDRVAVRLLYDVTGDPIDVDQLGRDLHDEAAKLSVRSVGFDPLTDASLARHLRRTEPITGQKYAAASSRFVEQVESRKVAQEDSHAVGEDLSYTARKAHDERGSFQAVRASDERPITAALAVIRAVWLATAPRPTAVKPTPSVVGF
jgi:hypothetical protein